MFPSIVVKPTLVRKDVIKKKISNLIVTGGNVSSARQKRPRRKLAHIPFIESYKCDCNSLHLTQLRVTFAPKSRKRGASTIVLSMTTLGSTCQTKRIKLRSKQPLQKVTYRKKYVEPNYENDELFIRLENQLKALNLGKPAAQKKSKAAVAENGSGGGAGGGDQSARDEAGEAGEAGEARRRGRRRRKGRHSIDRLTSAGLAAGAAQDPETQIAGIGTDSHNASSRGSLAPAPDAADDAASVPGAPRGRASATAAAVTARRISSFLDDDILKFLHREVDQNAIETEFDTKRRYVLEEALRTRPERPLGREMQSLLQEMRGSGAGLGAGEAAGLADWLHIPRVFSRRSAQFTLPLDSAALQTLTPMQYAARYVTLKNSKQLLYLTVLQKLRPNSYKMPVRHISEGLTLMMGGTLKPEQAESFRRLMAWDVYEEQLNFSDDIKLTLARRDSLRSPEAGHGTGAEKTIKYRTWCGVCAVCERCYGRFHPRDKDPPDGMEQSDFSMLETKLASLNVDLGLVEILNIIRTR